MKKLRSLLVGGLVLALALSLVAGGCAKAVPEGAAEEEIAALESKLAAEKSKVSSLEDDVSDLEKEIAALKKPAEVFELKFSSWCSRGSFYFDDIYVEFAQNINNMSGGRIEVETYGAGEVAAAGEVFEALRTGMLDIGNPWPSYYKGVVPEGELEGTVLGGLQNLQEVETLFWLRGWADILRNEVYAPLDLYYLGPNPCDAGYRIVSRNPITSLDDIEGLLVRAVPPVSTLLDNLGAQVVYVPWGEQYTAMATGTIDAAVYGDFPDTRDLHMHEFAPYHMDPPLAGYTNANFLVTMDVWDSLPEDLQDVLQVACWENGRYSAIVGMDKMLGAWTEIHAEGAEVTYLSQEDAMTLRLAEMELLDELGATSATMGKLVKIYKDFMVELGYLD